MTLVDTSVWIQHFRSGSRRLKTLLEDGEVVTHPFVIGELACGNLGNRAEILDLLGRLPQTPTAEHHEVMALVAGRRLYGRGIGWVDAHLLAAALLVDSGLWTLDRPLATVAAALGVAQR